MDRRNSGSYARPPSQYYEYDQQPSHSERPLPHQPAIHVPKSRQSAAHGSQPIHFDTNASYPARKHFSPTSQLSPNYNSRHGSVSDRSPLQKLEGQLGDISKEEKRARIEEAENRARQYSTANQSRRVNFDGQTLPSSSLSNEPGYRRERRHSSAPIPGQPEDRQRGRQSLDFGGGNPSRVPDSQAVDASQKFRRASDALRMQDQQRREAGSRAYSSDFSTNPQNMNELERSSSKKYRHRARDAGFAGAAAAASPPVGNSGLNDIDRREDRRRSSASEAYPSRPLSQDKGKRASDRGYDTGNRDVNLVPMGQQHLQSHRTGAVEGLKAAAKHQDPDPIPPSAVKTGNRHGPSYQIPPQTAAGQDARDHIGFGGVQPVQPPRDAQAQSGRHHRHHGFNDFFHRDRHQERVYKRGPELQDWRQAGVARLTLDDLTLDHGVERSTHFRDKLGYGRRSGSGPDTTGAYDGPYDEESKTFRPALYLKCGPLLRYTGMRRERLAQPSRSGVTEREIWCGTVMIVTVDSHSSYDGVPSLRLFAQPMDLLPPLPTGFQNDELPSQYLDPIAGQVKVSRTGRPLFVKPVELLKEGVDVSRVENESGLFELNKSPSLGPQHVNGPDGQRRQHITNTNQSRVRNRDGEKIGKYREVKGARLHAERAVTFWRFGIEIELGSSQARVAYRINQGPAIGFWVPARGQTMNMMFHSCNGFSLSVDSNTFTGPDPLWRDVMNKHQSIPFHVMLGGGDQIYNDAAMRDTVIFKEWLQIKNPEHKHKAEFTEDMQDELEQFYLDRYSMWFSQGLFGMASSQIPMVNIWDDHDIIDGYGSYPHHFMSTKVFTGLGAVAFKYYMLFQHQSVVSETQRDEPSWLLGASPGPYINELSRNVFMFLGRKVAFLGLDCRTERMRDEILSQRSYDIIFERCRREIIKGDTKHLIVLLGVPIAYPRLNFLENILTSRVMDPIKAIGRTGLLGGFVNKFDGGVEILDDLDDHWTAKHHKAERNWFIQELQELAAEKSVRVTILGGDVHLGAVGQFFTKKKLGVSKDKDHRYMPNIVSSAIVNTPPPTIMADVLNKRNKIHHLDTETDETMIPMFEEDVDGKPRNNHHLLPRRNFCIIREYNPGFTPPPSRSNSISKPESLDSRQYPPGSMKGTTATTRGGFRPGSLMRRLSGSGRERSASLTEDQTRHDNHDSYPENPEGGYQARRHSRDVGSDVPSSDTRPTFHRRPTDFSEKAALKASAKGGADANMEGREVGHINLEGGLDISLNMEVNQQDPAGVTAPYRLLVPALWYEGDADINDARFKSKGASLMDHLRGRTNRMPPSNDRSYESDESRSSSQGPDGMPSRRLNDGPLDPRRQASGHRPVTESGRQYGHDGSPGTAGYTKEFEATPPTSQHPAGGRQGVNKEHETSRQPPADPHPSQVPVSSDTEREKRSWNIFGLRRRGHEQEPYSEYTQSEGSYTGSEFEDDDEYQQPQPSGRRPSAVERFFGTGGREQEGGPYGKEPIGHQTAGQKPGWKIWR